MRFRAGAILLLTACWPLAGQSHKQSASAARKAADPPEKAPAPEKQPAGGERLTYEVEWRLIHAGTAVVESQKSTANLKLDSAGVVSTLFKVHDLYTSNFDNGFCAASASMDSQEGKRHHDTKVTYDGAANRATYLERDLVKETVLRTASVQIPECVHEVLGAFLKLRDMKLAQGQSAYLPMSDGRRSAQVKVEAQEREEVKTASGTHSAIRYEASMLNGVIYPRKGRVFIWLTDDDRRLPVQIRLRMNFPVGTVTLQLAKEEKF